MSQKIDYNPGPRAYYFGDLCERPEFIQLRELYLDQIQVTSGSVKSMLTKAKKTLAILTLTGVRLIDNEIKSANHYINSPGQGASNTPQIDSPARSHLRYTYPPYFFYPRISTVPPPACVVQSYSANIASHSPAPSLSSAPTQNYSPLWVDTQKERSELQCDHCLYQRLLFHHMLFMYQALLTHQESFAPNSSLKRTFSGKAFRISLDMSCCYGSSRWQNLLPVSVTCLLKGLKE